jgi:pyruvyltransferase
MSRHFILSLRRFLCDAASLLRCKKIFVYAYVRRQGLGFARQNWGDDINISFLEEISDLKVLILNHSRIFPHLPVKTYSCIGSILGECFGKNMEIWGSGFRSDRSIIHIVPRKVHSVRGPLTRQRLLDQGIDCPPVYGDPALLVSKYYRPKSRKKYKYGIMPHYADEKNPLVRSIISRPDVLIISMASYEHWHDIPDAVCSCEMILSSSLHGLIVADSYGIPSVWARFSDNIAGGGFKYMDYFASVGRDVRGPVYIGSREDLDATLEETSRFGVAKDIDFQAIFDACPFKEHLKRWQE